MYHSTLVQELLVFKLKTFVVWSGQALVWCGMSKFGVIYCGMALWFLLELSIKTNLSL